MGKYLSLGLLLLSIVSMIPEARNKESKCKIRTEKEGIIIDCSRLQLENIPNICDHENTTSNLDVTTSEAVSPEKIVKLDLSHNVIRSTGNNSFYCLVNLQELNLEGNKIELNLDNYYPGLFLPLVSLVCLNLKNNSKNGTVNDTVFAELINLQNLKIDAPKGIVFGKQFSNLKSLETLNVSGKTGHCDLNRIGHETFENLQHIRVLDLSACNIKNVESGSFGMMGNLTFLSLSFNKELGFQSLQNVTNGLQDTNIQFLHLENIRCLVGPGTELCVPHLAPLANTSLKELNLAGNRLNWMEKSVLSNLPKSLERMSLAHNRLSLGWYSFEYRLLKNLTVFNISFQLNPPSIVDKLTENCNEIPDFFRCSAAYFPMFNASEQLDQSLLQNKRKDKTIKKKSKPTITFYIPPKLETVYWTSSRLFGTLGSFGFYPSSLKRIYMQNNIWFNWIGPVHGFENVTDMDLSRNFCDNISTEFLSNFISLKTLNISENFLGRSLSLDYLGKTFRNLKSLETIDLSFNVIEFLHRNMFLNSSKLQRLVVDNNKLFKWEVKTNHMKNLSLLDLSDNRLTILEQSAMQDLETLFFSGNPNLMIDLDNNRLSCSCRNLVFLTWLRSYKSRFINYENYTCMEDSSNLDLSIDTLKTDCKSYLLWYIIGSISGTLFVSLIISFSIYKNRWKIRYLRYIANKKFHGYQRLPLTSGGEFEYDAYVSYSVKDVSFIKNEMVPNLEERFGLKLAIMHRDMPPCGNHATNIMDYICQCKRTLCVVSRNYLESTWQDYELNMARMEGLEARRGMAFVHLMLMPDVCQSKYPRKVRDFIREGNYIEYPDDQLGKEVFWEILKKEIQKDLPLSASIT